jgi:hypothetical protein
MSSGSTSRETQRSVIGSWAGCIKEGFSLATQKGNIMKSPAELHQKLRQRILNLSGVTERQNAGIHDDAFFVGRTMFMHIHGHGHCDIRLWKGDQERVLAEGKARPHRWAPEAGYVTFMVDDEGDLEPAMDLIRMAHHHFAGKQNVLQKQHQ